MEGEDNILLNYNDIDENQLNNLTNTTVNFFTNKVKECTVNLIKPTIQKMIDKITTENNNTLNKEYVGFSYKNINYLSSYSNNTNTVLLPELDDAVKTSNIHILEFIYNFEIDIKKINSFIHTCFTKVDKLHFMVGLLPEYYQVTLEHNVQHIPPVDYIFKLYPQLNRHLWEKLIKEKLNFYTGYAQLGL